MRVLGQATFYLGLLLGAALASAQSDPLDRWQGVTYPQVSALDRSPREVLVCPVRPSTPEPYWTGSGVYTVACWDDQIGWASGYGGVFATTDGGYTWKRMQPVGGWLGLAMTGPREVWLLGTGHGEPASTPRALLHTVDGGATWRPALSSTSLRLYSLYCRGREIWASGVGLYFHSADGGATWEEQRFGGLLPYPDKVVIPADRPTPGGFVIYATGWGPGARGARVVKSEDAGKTWAQLPTPTDLSFGGAGGSRPLFFVNSDTGWIGGEHGEVFCTSDGGQTWARRDLPTRRRVTALWFDQWGRGYAAICDDDYRRPTEMEALYQTQDGGRTWASALRNDINVFSFCDLGPGRIRAVGVTRSNRPEGIIAFLSAPPISTP